MKKGKRLIALAAVLALAVGGYFAVSKLANKQEDAKDSTIDVYSVDTSKVTQLSWTYLGETVALNYDSDKAAWIYKDDQAFPVDSKYPEAMLASIASITADRQLTDIGDYGEYGLDKSDMVISIATSDGESTKLTIGNQNPSTSKYYLRLNDDASVYLVGEELFKAFSYKLLDIVAMETIPRVDEYDFIAISSGTTEKKLKHMDEDENKNITYTDSYVWYYEGEGGSLKPVDDDKVGDITDAINNLSWSGCADYSVTDQELVQYGLKEPYAAVTVQYTESGTSDKEDEESPKTLTLLIGNASDSYRYARLSDSSMVYLIPSKTVDAIVSWDYESLRPDDVCLMDWDTVDSMDISIGDKTWTLDITRPQSDSENEETSYTVDGNAADSSKVKEFLDAITALKAETSTDSGSYSEKGEVVIVFHRNTESYKTMTMSFKQYDSSFYLLSFNGEARLLINKRDVSSLKEAFNKIVE